MPTPPDPSPRTERCLIVAASLLAAVQVLPLLDFVVDDAFIVFRYADNLVRHGELTFNLGWDPVEGFTSYLWLAVSGAALSLEQEPLAAVRIVSLGSLLVIVLVLASTRAPVALRTALIISTTLHPAVALHAVQGLETVATAALLLMAARCCVGYLHRPARATAGFSVLWAFLAILSRPDTTFALIAMGMATALLSRRQWHRLIRHFWPPLTIALVVGALFLVWRVRYFGHWLPNTFYVKFAPTAVGVLPEGALYAARFAALWLVPPFLFWLVATRGQLTQLRWSRTWLPALAAVLAHLAYLTTVNPIQGYLGRFAFPILPVFLLALLEACETTHRARKSTWIAAVVLCLASLCWWPEVLRQVDYRTPSDRIAAGRALARFEGTMFTGAAGALPYFSRWIAVDHLGLTSDEIAHDGLTVDLLQRLDPDLVALPTIRLVPQVHGREPAGAPLRFLEGNDYELVACVERNADFDFCYFVSPRSAIRRELREQLQDLDGVSYAETDWFSSRGP